MAFNFQNSSPSTGGQLQFNCSTGVPQNLFQPFGTAQTSPFVVTNPIQSMGGGQPVTWPFGTPSSQGQSQFPFGVSAQAASIFGGQGQQQGTNTSLFGGQGQQQGTGTLSLFGGQGQQQGTGTSIFGNQSQPQGAHTSLFGGPSQPQGTSLFGNQSMRQGQNGLTLQPQAQSPFQGSFAGFGQGQGYGQASGGYLPGQMQSQVQQMPPITHFAPTNGFTQTAFNSGHGQSTLAMQHLNKLTQSSPPSGTIPLGGSQDFFRNLKWGSEYHQPGQSPNSAASVATGQFMLVDTGVLAKLLQGQTASAARIPAAKSPPRNRFDEMRSDISDLYYQSPVTGAQYQPMSNRSSARFPEAKPSFIVNNNIPYPYRPSRPPPPESPRLMCTRRDDYFADFVPVSQFRPQANPTLHSRASRRCVDNQRLQPPRQAEQTLGHRLSFKPPPIDTKAMSWKEFSQKLKSVDSGMIEPEDFAVPLNENHGSLGQQFNNSIKNATQTGPPREGGCSSFSNLIEPRVYVPVPCTVRNMSYRPQSQPVVANLSHRVSQQHTPTFQRYFPNEKARASRSRDPSTHCPEIQELFRKDNPRIPLAARTSPTSNDQNSNDGWISLTQRRPSDSIIRVTTTLEDDGSSLLEKAVFPKNVPKSEPPKTASNKTRSRRARCKMTCTTQEKNRCRVILSRDQYYCRPDIASLDAMTDDDGHCLVTNFEVGHFKWGKVVFEGTFDVAGINLDTSIDIVHKAVVLHKGTDAFPSIGQGLNRSATVTLHNVWYNNPLTKVEVRDPSKLKAMNYERVLKSFNAGQDAEFVSYDYTNGDWVYKVKYFLSIVTLPPVTCRETIGQEEQGELGIIPEESESSLCA